MPQKRRDKEDTRDARQPRKPTQYHLDTIPDVSRKNAQHGNDNGHRQENDAQRVIVPTLDKHAPDMATQTPRQPAAGARNTSACSQWANRKAQSTCGMQSRNQQRQPSCNDDGFVRGNPVFVSRSAFSGPFARAGDFTRFSRP